MNKRQKQLLEHIYTLVDGWIAFPFPGLNSDVLDLLVHIRDCVNACLRPRCDCQTLTKFHYDWREKR